MTVDGGNLSATRVWGTYEDGAEDDIDCTMDDADADWRWCATRSTSDARSPTAPRRRISTGRWRSHVRWSTTWPSTWPGKPPEGLVFTSACGAPLRNYNFRSRVFAPAATAIGVPKLTPHDLRHTAASLAVQAGANVKAVQRMLGHASAAMTLEVDAGSSGTTWTPLRTGSTRPPLGLVRTTCGLRAGPLTSCRSTSEAQVAPDLAILRGRAGGARTRDPRIMSPLL